MYGGESTVAMVDDGSGSDAVAGDTVYTGIIPAGVANPGEMLRYYITAEDTLGNAMRGPRITDTTGTDRSPEYFGTVISDPAVTSELPDSALVCRRLECWSNARRHARVRFLCRGVL